MNLADRRDIVAIQDLSGGGSCDVWRAQMRVHADLVVKRALLALRVEADWRARIDIDARTAALLPSLLLARIDGKPPVEYLTREDDKARVRDAVRAMLKRQPATLDDLLSTWVALR